MIMTCELCGSDFLTEADAYVVRPTPKGYRHYCSCMIINHDQVNGIDKVSEENKVLKSILLEVSKQLIPYSSIGNIEYIRSEISRGLKELDE